MRLRKLIVLFALPLFAAINGCAQRPAHGPRIAVAFYNCENFFDTFDDPAKNDDEFTPAGKYHYTRKIYDEKLHNIATVISSMDDGNGPSIMGMAEVENATVLQDLVSEPELARKHYGYVWYSGPDPRGINVAMLYDPAHFRVIRSEPLHVDLSGTGGKSATRDVLEVNGVLDGDTVLLFVNHWPSRIGGEEASEEKRMLAAGVDKTAISVARKQNPGVRIIVMGDLNDNPTDKSVSKVLAAKDNAQDVNNGDLFDPFTAIFRSGIGTETFRHVWNLFDQVIISGSLLHGVAGHLHYTGAEIYKPGFIIDHYKGHEGEPKRSFVGTHWINGYSDHFPVILYLAH